MLWYINKSHLSKLKWCNFHARHFYEKMIRLRGFDESNARDAIKSLFLTNHSLDVMRQSAEHFVALHCMPDRG